MSTEKSLGECAGKQHGQQGLRGFSLERKKRILLMSAGVVVDEQGCFESRGVEAL